MKYLKLFLLVFLFGVIAAGAQEKKYITYKVKEGESIQSIAKSLSVTPYDLLKLNPDVTGDVKKDDLIVIPNKDYDPVSDITNVDISQIGARDIVVDNFIYHETVPKETLFSLGQKYKVSEEELKANNPFLMQDGLQIGQVIKIPMVVDEQVVEEKDKNTQPYIVKPKETKYSISRQFGISIEYLEQLNPKIAIEGLQIDDVILVPKDVVGSSDEEMITYKVEKLETIYSLTNKFGLSYDELLDANPALENGVKEGMVLRIPNVKKAEKSLFEDKIDRDRTLSVAMMLPFKANRDSLDFERDQLLEITTDYYSGALLALDSLKGQGMSVRMVVYDTENNSQLVDTYAGRAEFEEYDAIIGPMFLSNMRKVSDNVNNSGTLLVSPISTKDHSSIDNKQLVQLKPSLDQQVSTMLDYIKEKHESQNLIIIRNNSNKSDQIYNRIKKDIEALSSPEEVIVLKPEEGYINPEEFRVFRDTLDRDIVNWFLVTDDEPAFLGDVFNNLGVFPEQDSLVVFGFEQSRNLDKIDNNFLSRVHFHYPSNTVVQANAGSYRKFEAMYRRRYHALPSVYALEGFDAAYDMLMRLSSGKDLLEQGASERISTKFEYIENTSGSMLNNGVFLVKYEDLEIKVLNGQKN